MSFCVMFRMNALMGKHCTWNVSTFYSMMLTRMSVYRCGSTTPSILLFAGCGQQLVLRAVAGPSAETPWGLADICRA